MANTIQAISSMKRLIFIDNITNDKAKELSAAYKYAICFSNDNGKETIWKAGKPYMYIREIDNSVLQLGPYTIQLMYNEGKLMLSTGNIVKNIQIYSIKNSNGEEILPNGNTYNIFTNDNKFNVYVKCLDEDNNVVINHPQIIFLYSNTLYNLGYSLSSSGNDIYEFTITKTENQDNNEKSFEVKIDEQINSSYNLNIKYCPQNVIWYNSSNNIIEFINLDFNNQIIYFKLDKTNLSELEDGYKLNFKIGNNIIESKTLPLANNDNYIILNKTILDELGDQNSNLLKLEYVDNNNNLFKEFSNYLQINEVEFEENLFYIGPNIYSSNIVINNNDIINDIAQTGWHKFTNNEYNYNDNPLTVHDPWCVILPINAKLRVRLYKIKNDYTTYVIDGDSYDITNIIVNGIQYKKMTPKFTSNSFINTITIN